jgi:hypothetical protein
MTDVFISYARSDQSIAEKLQDLLTPATAGALLISANCGSA